MATFAQFNPFAKHETYGPASLWVCRFFSIIAWLLAVITTVYYTIHEPRHGRYHCDTIWGQNKRFPTAFTIDGLVVTIYWLVLFLLQLVYLWHLFSSKPEWVNAAAGVSSHFTVNYFLQSAWVMLFVRSYFRLSELILIIKFLNLSFLYIRYPVTPRLIHIPAVSGPLAWTFVAIYWNGAIAVNPHSHNFEARLLGYIAIWGILVYGLFFLVTFKDYTMGFALSILTAAIGVSQFFRHGIAYQWIFAFIITALLFVATLVIALPGVFGGSFRRDILVVAADRERAPLLQDA